MLRRPASLVMLVFGLVSGCGQSESSPLAGTWTVISIDDQPLPPKSEAIVVCRPDGSITLKTSPEGGKLVTTQDVEPGFRSVRQPKRDSGIQVTLSYGPGSTLHVLTN